MDWQEVIAHPSLKDLPFKVETNEWGQIVMSPASNRHGRYQITFGRLLEEYLGGTSVSECSIETSRGVKVADVAWTSETFRARYGDQTPYPKAPELCVEIVSPSNTEAEMQEKITLYLAKGAREVWLCDEEGHVRFFDHEGEQERSELAPDFPREM